MPVSVINSGVIGNPQFSMFNVQEYGVVGDSAVGGKGTDDTAKIQAVFDMAAAESIGGGPLVVPSIYFPPGYFRITGPVIIKPSGGIGSFTQPRIYGEGMWHQSTIVCDGPAAGFVYQNDGATYQRWGGLSDLAFEAINGALTAVTNTWSSAIRIERLLIHAFANEGLFIENSNTPTARDCYLYGNGSASHSQVRFNLCTVVKFDHNYISASANAMGGISLERSQGAVQNCAIESTGINIIVSGETENAVACSTITIADNDLENPIGSPPVHISVGKGLSGVFIRSVRVQSNNAAPNIAGTAGALGCDVAQCQQFEADGNIFRLGSNAAASYNFGAAASVPSAVVRAQRQEVGNAFPWVMVNGAQVMEATPYADWYNLQSDSGLQIPKLVTTAPTSTLNNLQNVQGGLYQIMLVGNAGGALTINTLAQSPVNTGYPLVIVPTDGNITLKHNFAAKGFILKTNADTLLVINNPVQFIYVSSTGKWHQI